MAALLRMKGGNVYSKYKHNLTLVLNANVNESLCCAQLFKLRSMCSYVKIDDGHKSSPIISSTQSKISPPEPIPNRPLRDDSGRPSYVPQEKSQSRPFISVDWPEGQNKNQIPQASGGEDFLQRFQLESDHKKTDQGLPPKEEKTDASAAEVSPQPLQDPDELFKKMKENGLIPNAVAMLDGLCKDGLVQEALKLFGYMREKGSLPEVVIYTAVIQAFCEAYKHDEAVSVFRKMQSNAIAPNAFTFSVLIQGLCQGTRSEEAFGICLEMLEGGHSPNLATFIALVDGFCKEKGLEDAKNMIQTLKQKGFYLDVKSVQEYLRKKGPSMPLVWEATLGKKPPTMPNIF